MSITLPRLPQTAPSHSELQVWWQQVVEAIEAQEAAQDTLIVSLADAVAAIQAAQDAADAANAAADAANAAAEATLSESSLNNSYVGNFTAPLVSADSTGNVTIANHDRIYGDSTLNPTVAVTGDVIATGQANPAQVFIYYSDPPRAGGAVTYQWSLDEADAAQTGDVHSVGNAVIPSAGTSEGGYVRPPGYAYKFEV